MYKSLNSFNVKEDEVLQMFRDTSELAARKQVEQLQIVSNAYKASNDLTSNVEFWAWMDRNFNGAGGNMFASNSALNAYLSKGDGKVEWVRKQLQGKGYEWDWMQQQRSSFRNVFRRYDAGNISNQAAIDVTEYEIISGTKAEYQMKAYVSKNNPDLHNTGKNVIVVTNAEKVDVVSKKGYVVEEFKNRQEIVDDVDRRMADIKRGSATPSYSLKNVSGAMAKAGMVGCVFGVGTEAFFSYEKWRNAELTDDEYLREILRSGGDAGTTAAVTTGIMVPVSSSITVLGASSMITIPIAFAVSSGVRKIVSPCFGRGDYRKILNKAKYYQSIECMYQGFMQSVGVAVQEYEYFSKSLLEQENEYRRIKQKDEMVTKSLKNIFNLI